MADTDIKYECEDEIELMDILLVIWRWKLFIIGFTVLIVVAALVFLFFQKNIYRVSITIYPAVLEQTIDGKDHYVDTTKNIKALIDSNILNNRIVDKLGSENIPGGSLSFAVKIIKSTNQLVVSLDHSSPDIAVDILKLLAVFLNEQYQSKIDNYVEKQKEKIIKIDAQLSFIKNSKTEIELIKSRIIEVRGKIKDIEQQNEILLGQQKALLSILSGRSISDILLLFNRISLVESRLDSFQNLVYHLEINNMVKQRQMFSAGSGIMELDSKRLEKDLIQNQITRANLIKANNEVIRMLFPPKVSSSPVKPKKRLILSLVFISGLLISLFISFFLEYFRNYKNRKQERK